MKIVVRPDAAAVAELVARLIANQLRARPRTTLGLATGRTMERIYVRLAALHRSEKLDFSQAASFNLDEYIGLPASDPRSYRRYMDRFLFDHVDIVRERTHVPDGMASDHAAEGLRYESAIHDAGGIDLQLLGIGETGHIGFNEPLSAFTSRTRDVTLAPHTRRQNAAMFGDDDNAVPPRAMTMGIATILDARQILLVATGARKARMLAQTVEGPMTAMISGTALQSHPNCLVLADEPAAAQLTERAYYDHLARYDPEILALPG